MASQIEAYRQIRVLQQHVIANLPMFTLTHTQRRKLGWQHWRVNRHGIFQCYPTPDQRAPLNDPNSYVEYEWNSFKVADKRPTSSTIHELKAQADELGPKAQELFRQVTAPRLVLQSVNREQVHDPKETLAVQMQEVLKSFSDRFWGYREKVGWPRDLRIIETVTFSGGLEMLRFDSSSGVQWMNTSWGMYENLEGVLAQLATWERLYQAVLQAQLPPKTD